MGGPGPDWIPDPHPYLFPWEAIDFSGLRLYGRYSWSSPGHAAGSLVRSGRPSSRPTLSSCRHVVHPLQTACCTVPRPSPAHPSPVRIPTPAS